MVPQLLALKDLVDRVAHECFLRNERFLLSTKESFEFFINERSNKPAEMLGIVERAILLISISISSHILFECTSVLCASVFNMLMLYERVRVLYHICRAMYSSIALHLALGRESSHMIRVVYFSLGFF